MVLHMKAAGALFLTFIEGVVKVSMFRYLLAVLSCAPILALLLIFAPPAEAKRVALVIGNNNYENVPDLEGGCFEHRSGDVALVRESCQPDEHTSGIGSPAWSEQP